MCLSSSFFSVENFSLFLRITFAPLQNDPLFCSYVFLLKRDMTFEISRWPGGSMRERVYHDALRSLSCSTPNVLFYQITLIKQGRWRIECPKHFTLREKKVLAEVDKRINKQKAFFLLFSPIASSTSLSHQRHKNACRGEKVRSCKNKAPVRSERVSKRSIIISTVAI